MRSSGNLQDEPTGQIAHGRNLAGPSTETHLTQALLLELIGATTKKPTTRRPDS